MTSAEFGLGCNENWCIQVAMVPFNEASPGGLGFDHETENRLNSAPVENYVYPSDEDASGIMQSVANKTGYTYVAASALNPDVRKFLFNY